MPTQARTRSAHSFDLRIDPAQERLSALMGERKHLIDEGWAPGDGKGGPPALRREDSRKQSSSGMVEKERARLEVLKRRQERELQQMVQYEVTRKELLDKQQRKVDELEKRTQVSASGWRLAVCRSVCAEPLYAACCSA